MVHSEAAANTPALLYSSYPLLWQWKLKDLNPELGGDNKGHKEET